MADACPSCRAPYGRRRRCYYCNGRSRTGEWRDCAHCGKSFYVQRNVMNDTARHAGTYCSVTCKNGAMRGIPPRSARLDEPLMHAGGYVLIWAPAHARAHGGRVFEHVLVAEQMLGRPLLPNERVHHRDHDRANNASNNLEVLTNRDHSRLHAAERRRTIPSRLIELQCAECDKAFSVKPSRANNPDPKSRSKYCSRKCKSDAVSRQTAERHRLRREMREAEASIGASAH